MDIVEYSEREDPAATGRTASPLPDDARAILHGTIRRRLRWESEDDIEDLVSESLLQYYRAARREEARDPGALLRTIGDRVALDWIRRRIRWGIIMVDAPPEDWDPADERADAAAQVEDPVAMGAAIIRLYFAENDHGCARLFDAYRQELDWKSVAAAWGEQATTIRKRWSRCVAQLRDVAQRSSGFAPLRDWFGADA